MISVGTKYQAAPDSENPNMIIEVSGAGIWKDQVRCFELTFSDGSKELVSESDMEIFEKNLIKL
jgi:hypothetical protein